MKAILTAAVIFVCLLPSCAAAHGFTAGTLEIVHPFLRATPPRAAMGAGYLVIKNTGTASDRLLGIETSAARRVAFHQSIIEDGIAKMRPIEGGLEIPSAGEYRLGEDGSHAMLVDLTGPISERELIEGTLIFERAGRVEMYFEVESAGATLSSAQQEHGSDH